MVFAPPRPCGLDNLPHLAKISNYAHDHERCYGDNYTFIFHAPVAEMAERRFLTLECRVPFSFLRSLLFIFRRVQECITLNVQKYCHAQQTTNLGENTACWTFGRLPSSFFFAIFPFKTAKKHRLILFYD